MKISIRNVFLFAVLLIIGAVCGYSLMYENKWDFTNYHYYNAWAFLNGRVGYDIAPASVNTYNNPLIEIPFYYMVKYLNDYPGVVSALQGMYFGILVFMVFKIVELFFSQGYRYKNLLTVLSTLIGVTGFATFMQVSTTSNEIQTAILVLWAFYILLKVFSGGKGETLPTFFSSGLLLGMAAGLKLTAVIYCASIFFTLLIFRKKLNRPGMLIFMFCLGGTVGFLLINGFWMWKLWTLLGNPVFPFANTIFKSEYFDNFNYSDRRFLPKNLTEYIFYPFIWAFHFERRVVAETYFIDFRFAAVYLILLYYAVRRFVCKFKESDGIRFLFVYIVCSYAIWLLFFSILRYAIPIEVFSGVIIVKFAYDTFPVALWKRAITISVWILLFFILISMAAYSVPWGTRRGDAKVIDVEKIEVTEDDVILLYNMPSAAIVSTLIPGKSKVRVMGTKQGNVIVMGGTDFTERKKFRLLRDEVLKNRKGRIIAIVREWYNSLYNVDVTKDPYLKDLQCRPLLNNLDDHLNICM